MWAEFSPSTPHLQQKVLLVSPINWRCLLRVLCPVRRPVTTLDCVLLKDKSLVFALGLRAKLFLKPVSEYYQELRCGHYQAYNF
jgi:hypothetical protein